jgi:hypothetical protein
MKYSDKVSQMKLEDILSAAPILKMMMPEQVFEADGFKALHGLSNEEMKQVLSIAAKLTGYH